MGVAPENAEQISEIHIGGKEGGLQSDCRFELVLGLRDVSTIAIERSEVDARLRAVGVVPLRVDELAGRTSERGTFVCPQLIVRHAGHEARGFDPQRPQWVGKQRGHKRQPDVWRDARKRLKCP